MKAYLLYSILIFGLFFSINPAVGNVCEEIFLNELTNDDCMENLINGIESKIHSERLEEDNPTKRAILQEMEKYFEGLEKSDVSDRDALEEKIKNKIAEWKRAKQVDLPNDEKRPGPALDEKLERWLEKLEDDLLDMDGLAKALEIADGMEDRKNLEDSEKCTGKIDEIREKIKNKGCKEPYDSQTVKREARKILRDEIEELKKGFPVDDECLKKLREIRKGLSTEDVIESKAAAERAFDAVISSSKGTGRTTGHIADISVKNNNPFPIATENQSFFIPSSDGRYQSYAGTIEEGIVIPPGATTTFPVNGYCTDISAPPVPSGNPMPDMNEWIPVTPPGNPSLDGNPPTMPEPMNPPGGEKPTYPADPVYVSFVPGPSVPEFTPDLINEIVNSDEFIPDTKPSENPQMTWPGTNIVIDGSFDKNYVGPQYASVVVTTMHKINDVIPDIQSDPNFTTPFKSDSLKEAESIGQQTMWIFTSGGDYGKDEFTDKVYEQYELTTGKDKDELEEVEKEKLESGVDDFFNSFMATGVSAKVFREGTDNNGNGDNVLISDDRCDCDTLSFTLSILKNGIYTSLEDYTSTTFRSSGSNKESENDSLSAEDYEEIELKVHNIKFSCSCNSGDCPHYSDRSGDEDQRNNFHFSTRTSSTRAGAIKDESDDGKELTFAVDTNNDFKNVYVYITIKAYCESDDCSRKICSRKFRRNFVKKTEEE